MRLAVAVRTDAMKSPAFQLYVNDFLGSAKVGVMNGAEIGIYFMLLLLDWQETGFAFDAGMLARWCRVSEGDFNHAWTVVQRCFTKRRGRYYSLRLVIEREKQSQYRAKSREGGLKSAAARRLVAQGTSTTVQPPSNTPFPFPFTISTTPIVPPPETAPSVPCTDSVPQKRRRKPPPEEPDPAFEEAWAAYPRRSGSNPRSGARRQWDARITEGEDRSQMLAGAQGYARWARAEAKVGTEFVMQGSRFWGRDKCYLDFVPRPGAGALQVPPAPSGPAPEPEVGAEERERQRAEAEAAVARIRELRGRARGGAASSLGDILGAP